MEKHKCSVCGYSQRGEFLRCPTCGEFGTAESVIVESSLKSPKGNKDGSNSGLKTTGAVSPTKKARKINELTSAPISRTQTGIEELDRVLGGGLVDSEVVLLAGSPGAGKALAGSTWIPMFDGSHKKMSDIKVGDKVVDGKGYETTVTGKFHPEVKKAYRLKFESTKVDACEDHIWVLYDTAKNNITRLTTKEVFESFGKHRYMLPAKRIQNETVYQEYLNKFNRTVAKRKIETSNENKANTELRFESKKGVDKFVSIASRVGVAARVNGLDVEFTVGNEHLQWRKLKSIKETEVKEEYYCIQVDSPRKTYMCTRSNIQTHNTTLCTKLSDNFGKMGKKVLYVSGEESENQIGLRAKRMGVSTDNMYVVSETNLEKILGHINEVKPDLFIVDSLQTIASKDVSGSVGSIAQSKEAAHTLTRIAKEDNIMMVLINQVNKQNEFAGAEAIQHIVDAGLMFESDNDTILKFLRTTKNRFGPTDEVGVFQHTETGLEGVTDPSGIFLETNDSDVYGSACGFISEGVRQMPIEVQALVVASSLTNPRKQFSGVNFTRGQIICAILDKFCGTRLAESDVFVSTVSGVRVNDPMSDLAAAASIVSSFRGKPAPVDSCFVGELSLTGQVRGSHMINGKIREAERLGFKQIYVPHSSLAKITGKNNIKVIGIKKAKQLRGIIG